MKPKNLLNHVQLARLWVELRSEQILDEAEEVLRQSAVFQAVRFMAGEMESRAERSLPHADLPISLDRVATATAYAKLLRKIEAEMMKLRWHLLIQNSENTVVLQSERQFVEDLFENRPLYYAP